MKNIYFFVEKIEIHKSGNSPPVNLQLQCNQDPHSAVTKLIGFHMEDEKLRQQSQF